MKTGLIGVILLMFCGVSAAAETVPGPIREPYAIPAVDAPELAALGRYQVGTQTIAITTPITVELTPDGVSSSVRTIAARVWYPADVSDAAARTAFTHILPRPDGTGAPFTIPSLAVEGAPIINGQKFPVVVVSHGYNGWDTFMTWLTENLATKGYVVVAIDHADQRPVHPALLPVSFGNVLINRAADVRAVISDLVDRSGKPGDALGRAIDPETIGLVGYSMGGFGVLGAAGMDYDPASPIFAQMPGAAHTAIFDSQSDGLALTHRIKAVVALAPFGGRADSRVWTAASVADFAKPVLMIDGDHDDIVDVKAGVSWIYDQMTSNERHFLLFANARHNVGGNPPPPEADSDFSTREYFAEPVWRTERINAINQHFITAFLGLHLKGEAGNASYLDVAPADSGDGQWPLAPFQNIGGQTATSQQPDYWRGFQRRWALGLEMRSGKPASE